LCSARAKTDLSNDLWLNQALRGLGKAAVRKARR
jgi:hypothetical protein